MQGGFAQGTAKQIVQQFGGTSIGQELVVPPIDADGLEARPILHGLADVGGKRCQRGLLTRRTGLACGTVLDHFQRQRRQVDHVAPVVPRGRHGGHGGAARGTLRRGVGDDVVRRGHEVQGGSRMAGLTAGRLATALAQTLGLGGVRSLEGGLLLLWLSLARRSSNAVTRVFNVVSCSRCAARWTAWAACLPGSRLAPRSMRLPNGKPCDRLSPPANRNTLAARTVAAG